MINQLHIKNFGRFSENNFTFSAGINVFIGQNSMGKTHLLKLLAANMKALQESNDGDLESVLTKKLTGYFKPERLGRLVRKQQRDRAEVAMTTGETTLKYYFSSNSKQVKIEQSNFRQHGHKSLYIPPREIISVFEGFIGLFQKREVNFDESYYQLALALDVPLLKEQRFKEVQAWIKPFEEITESRVIKQNGRFYLQDKKDKTKMEMPLVAEGYRKIATLMYLISNGELAQNSILFWDEPEANLNPKLTKKVVELLLVLAGKGVQIFIATHDYLLTNLLSLQSEYRDTVKEKIPDIQFFSLYQKQENLVFDSGDCLAALSQNPILDEFTALYNTEQQYFNEARF